MEPVRGMRAAKVAKTSATASWPTPTSSHVQIPKGPPVWSTYPYVVKMPVAIEMNENATANEANLEMVRLKGCSYPYRLTTASSSLSDAGVSVSCLSVTLSPSFPFRGVAQPQLIPFVLGVLAAP